MPEKRKILALGDSTKNNIDQVFTLSLDVYKHTQDCVHCGLCLPACPTYTENQNEQDSPRGRIHLIKGLTDGRIQPTAEVVKHLDLCLDCRACETACPSGVVYHELIEGARQEIERKNLGTQQTSKLLNMMLYHVFPYPKRLRLFLLFPRLLQKTKLWNAWLKFSSFLPLSPSVKKMQALLPGGGAIWPSPLRNSNGIDAHHTKRLRVAFFPGCVGSFFNEEVNQQAVELLNHFGVDVVVPENQACCGAMHFHGGKSDEAAIMAKQNIAAFKKMHESHSIDYICNTIAGCGAMLKDYAHLLGSDEDARESKIFVDKVKDITEILEILDIDQPANILNKTMTYHHACHHVHAQGISQGPLKLLAKIPGLKLIPLVQEDMCCGAAGTYNLTEAEMAASLGKRKAQFINDTGADSVIVANLGCSMQINAHLELENYNIKVLHPVTVLHAAYIK